VARRFALIGVAGWFATRFGLTGWGENEALEAAERAFVDWYDRRYGERRDAVETFVETLRDYFSKSLTSLPMVTGPHVSGVTPDGWRDASRVYLTPEAWARIFPGADGTAAAKAFHDMEMLLAGETGRLTRKAPRAIPGKRQRLYTLNIDRVNEFSAD
jgi:putative DNA primase/helicase